MPRYAETRDASSELLRLVLPMMSSHAVAFNPASYAVWYEYAAGTNPPLKEALDKLLASGSAVTDEAMSDLHEKYISGGVDAGVENMRAELERMLAELSSQAGSAGEHAEAYSASLNQFGESLKPGVDPQAMRAAVDAMVDNTRAMHGKTNELQTQLQESSREIESLRAELTRVKSEVLIDPLTSITNRRGFDRAVSNARAANGDQLTGFCLLMLDIDHFKQCNDTYGHLFGDKVICGVAQTIAKNVKGQDTAARIGGEEFAVLLPSTPLEGARVLAERIRRTIAAARIKNSSTDEMIGNITISVGVAQYAAGETIEVFMSRADKALYVSKAGGRNRVTVAPSPETAANCSDANARPKRVANT